ncbi:MAG: alpha/beta hydrolase, partial [Lentisphaeria bacterium]
MNKFFTSFLILASFVLNAAKTFEHSIQSKLMDANFKLKVIVPDSYDGNKSFRQVFLLHGAGGDQNTWNGDNLSENMADKYNRIFILPTAGKTSWYNNHNQSENFIINEIIPFIDDHYKTIPDRWITGLSMGGFGAIRLGYKYPKLFSAIGGLSACIKPSQWTNKWNIS